MGGEVGEAWESEMVVGERVALRRMRGWSKSATLMSQPSTPTLVSASTQ